MERCREKYRESGRNGVESRGKYLNPSDESRSDRWESHFGFQGTRRDDRGNIPFVEKAGDKIQSPPMEPTEPRASEGLGSSTRVYQLLEKDFSVAKLLVRAESPRDIPSSISVRSLGRLYVIKICVDDYSKEELSFADVWPNEKHSNGVDVESNDSRSSPSSSPSVRTSPSLPHFQDSGLAPNIVQRCECNGNNEALIQLSMGRCY
ncbi:hypothetical protein V6N13_075264 [Hibiscus sabdariffa]